MNYGARAGAALLMLGLWAGGPQVISVASADDGSTDQTVSAPVRGSRTAGQHPAPRPGKPIRNASPAAAVVATRALPTPRAASATTRLRPVVVRRTAVAARSAVTPTASVLTADTPAAPEPAAAAAANPVQVLDAAVATWFDGSRAWLASLPGGPLTDLLSGALLLVRRGFFNQQPTADPYQFATRATGQLVGTLGVVDPEGDALSYSLSKVPEFGTVEVASDGIWTYTPGPDFVYGTPESFTVTVSDGGFNIFDPTAAPLQVNVPIGLVSYDYQFLIQNATTRPVGYTKLSYEAYRQPPKGYQIQPGEQVQINISTRTTYLGKISDSVGLSTGTDTWKINYTYQGGWSFVCGASGGNAGCAKSQSDSTRALIGDSAGTYDYQPDSPGAVDALAKLSQMADQNIDGLTVKYLNAVYLEQQASTSDYTKKLTLDNPSDNSKSSGSQTITTTTSTTTGSSWKVGGGIKFSPIEKVLELTVSADYNKSVSETQTKTFTTTISQGLPPWSANEVLVAPPKLLANGDAVFTFTGLGTSYSFHNMDFLLPSQTTDVPLYVIRTEPLEPKDASGKPMANVGFTMKDKTSPTLAPTYSVGQRSQLTVTAFNGYGSDSADYTLRATYSSSDPSVATVDETGLLTAGAAGTATITARYDWVIPLGGGSTRADYVIATMNVKVA